MRSEEERRQVVYRRERFRSQRINCSALRLAISFPLDDDLRVSQSECCDTLLAEYATVHKIDITPIPTTSGRGQARLDYRVVIKLTAPPTLGKEPVYSKTSGTSCATDSSIGFALGKDGLGRFYQALKSRGLVGRISRTFE